MPTSYPETAAARDRWILAQREGVESARATLSAWRPYAFVTEAERACNGEIVDVATLFLTNRECPWRCLMCDLWRNTLAETVPEGAIPAQIDYALEQLSSAAPARHIKLYNSGSFFDARAIPPADHPAIAARVRGFERVIVESHAMLVGERCLRWRDLTGTASEIAIGLETVHPAVGPRLNKRATLQQFAAAAEFLARHDIALRVFVLVRPPFMDEAEGVYWAKRSVDFAFECGASVVALIPTRGGNGAMETLAAQGDWAPPRLSSLEEAAEYGVGLRRGRVFADLWDLEKFSACPHCLAARRARLDAMNRTQNVPAPIRCARCGNGVEPAASGGAEVAGDG